MPVTQPKNSGKNSRNIRKTVKTKTVLLTVSVVFPAFFRLFHWHFARKNLKFWNFLLGVHGHRGFKHISNAQTTPERVPQKTKAKNQKGCRVGSGQSAGNTAEKQREKQPKHPKNCKNKNSCLLTVSVVFPAFFRLFHWHFARDPVGTFFVWGFPAVFSVRHAAPL